MRTKSISSAMSGQSGSIAAALAKGSLGLAGAPLDVDLTSTSSRPSSNRSPFLVRGGDSALLDEDASEFDFDSDGSDLDDSLPVTGFAVASNRRQAEFHALFPAVDEGDYLIEGEWLATRELMVRLRLRSVQGHPGTWADICVGEPPMLSRQHLWMGHECESRSRPDLTCQVVIQFVDIRRIEKKMTALVIPNAIGITTTSAKVRQCLHASLTHSTPLPRSSPATQPTTS